MEDNQHKRWIREAMETRKTRGDKMNRNDLRGNPQEINELAKLQDNIWRSSQLLPCSVDKETQESSKRTREYFLNWISTVNYPSIETEESFLKLQKILFASTKVDDDQSLL